MIHDQSFEGLGTRFYMNESLLGEPDSLKEPISERPTYRLLPDSLSISLQRLAKFIFGIHILTKASCIFPQNQASFFRSLFIGISCLWELALVFHPLSLGKTVAYSPLTTQFNTIGNTSQALHSKYADCGTMIIYAPKTLFCYYLSVNSK